MSVQLLSSYSTSLRALTSDFRQGGTDDLMSTQGERQSRWNVFEEYLLLVVLRGTIFIPHSAAVYVRGTRVLEILTGRRSAHAQQTFLASMSSQRTFTLHP